MHLASFSCAPVNCTSNPIIVNYSFADSSSPRNCCCCFVGIIWQYIQQRNNYYYYYYDYLCRSFSHYYYHRRHRHHHYPLQRGSVLITRTLIGLSLTMSGILCRRRTKTKGMKNRKRIRRKKPMMLIVIFWLIFV